jgi:hypothetical protein
MRVLDSWGKTKDFFERKNFSLFILVTLKAIKTSYEGLLKFLGVPILLLIGLDILFDGRMSITADYCLFMVRTGVVIFMFLTVRPSLQQKIWQYYRHYTLHAVIAGVWVAALLLIPRMCSLGCVSYIPYQVLLVESAFAIFFFLDQHITFANFMNAQVQALKMFIYNLPICFIISLLVACVMAVVLRAAALVGRFFEVHVPAPDIMLLLAPIFLSILSNMYIKFLHEQSDVYFAQPK